ncbi:MAG: hypothetical protein LKM44_03530 [Wolbachia endosymbiont of Meromenopon meropis]|nr:hypothetical protein [Wolbachia endosymbiont of Meromenopon meropis]
MPQLDISTFFSQIFWFLFFFFLLFFVVGCFFLPKLDKIIGIRSKRLIDSLNASIYLLRLIEIQLVRYNKALDEARIKEERIVNDAINQVKDMRMNLKYTLDEESKKMKKLIEERVEKFKSDYIHELKQVATGIALIYYGKLTSSKIEKKFVTDLISKEF